MLSEASFRRSTRAIENALTPHFFDRVNTGVLSGFQTRRFDSRWRFWCTRNRTSRRNLRKDHEGRFVIPRQDSRRSAREAIWALAGFRPRLRWKVGLASSRTRTSSAKALVAEPKSLCTFLVSRVPTLSTGFGLRSLKILLKQPTSIEELDKLWEISGGHKDSKLLLTLSKTYTRLISSSETETPDFGEYNQWLIRSRRHWVSLVCQRGLWKPDTLVSVVSLLVSLSSFRSFQYSFVSFLRFSQRAVHTTRVISP